MKKVFYQKRKFSFKKLSTYPRGYASSLDVSDFLRIKFSEKNFYFDGNKKGGDMFYTLPENWFPKDKNLFGNIPKRGIVMVDDHGKEFFWFNIDDVKPRDMLFLRSWGDNGMVLFLFQKTRLGFWNIYLGSEN